MHPTFSTQTQWLVGGSADLLLRSAALGQVADAEVAAIEKQVCACVCPLWIC
jgi:hypothetical protein